MSVFSLTLVLRLEASKNHQWHKGKLINSTEGRERKELIQQRNMFTKYVVDMLDEIEQIDQIEDDDVKRQAKWLKYKAESEAVKTERGILKDIAGGNEKAPDIQALDKSERGQRSAIVEKAVKLDKKLDRSIKKTDDREKIDRLQERKRKNLEDAVEKLYKIQWRKEGHKPSFLIFIDVGIVQFALSLTLVIVVYNF